MVVPSSIRPERSTTATAANSLREPWQARAASSAGRLYAVTRAVGGPLVRARGPRAAECSTDREAALPGHGERKLIASHPAVSSKPEDLPTRSCVAPGRGAERNGTAREHHRPNRLRRTGPRFRGQFLGGSR